MKTTHPPPAPEGGSLPRLVGRFGEFSDSKGVTHACRVVREEGDILQVNYVPKRNVVSAWIERSAFSPNSKDHQPKCRSSTE